MDAALRNLMDGRRFCASSLRYRLDITMSLDDLDKDASIGLTKKQNKGLLPIHDPRLSLSELSVVLSRFPIFILPGNSGHGWEDFNVQERS